MHSSSKDLLITHLSRDYKLYKLTSLSSINKEGSAMKNCLKEKLFYEDIYYSVRFKDKSVATIEYFGGIVCQIKGKANQSVNAKHTTAVIEALNYFSKQEDNLIVDVDEMENIGFHQVNKKEVLYLETYFDNYEIIEYMGVSFLNVNKKITYKQKIESYNDIVFKLFCIYGCCDESISDMIKIKENNSCYLDIFFKSPMVSLVRRNQKKLIEDNLDYFTEEEINTSIIESALEGRVELFNVLLERIDIKKKGESLMQKASFNGNFSIVKILEDHGVNIDISIEYYGAFVNGSDEFVKYLISKGFDEELAYNFLFALIDKDNLKSFKRILYMHPNIDINNHFLYCCSKKNSKKIFNFLIDKVDKKYRKEKNTYGAERTALINACREENYYFIKKLLDNDFKEGIEEAYEKASSKVKFILYPYRDLNIFQKLFYFYQKKIRKSN